MKRKTTRTINKMRRLRDRIIDTTLRAASLEPDDKFLLPLDYDQPENRINVSGNHHLRLFCPNGEISTT